MTKRRLHEFVGAERAYRMSPTLPVAVDEDCR